MELYNLPKFIQLVNKGFYMYSLLQRSTVDIAVNDELKCLMELTF